MDCRLQIMHFILQLMDFVLKITDFILKMHRSLSRGGSVHMTLQRRSLVMYYSYSDRCVDQPIRAQRPRCFICPHARVRKDLYWLGGAYSTAYTYTCRPDRPIYNERFREVNLVSDCCLSCPRRRVLTCCTCVFVFLYVWHAAGAGVSRG